MQCQEVDIFAPSIVVADARMHVAAQAVLVEEDVLALEGLGAVVSVDSRRGDNIIREYNAGTQIRLQRALKDVQQLLPTIAVGLAILSAAGLSPALPTYQRRATCSAS